MFKQKLLRKNMSAILAFLLVFAAVFALMPLPTAHAAGIDLTANTGTTELISAGQITITGTISNPTADAITGVKLSDVTNGSPVDVGAGVATLEAGGAYNYTVTVNLTDTRHFNAGGQNCWRVQLQAEGTSASGSPLKSDPVAVVVTKAEAKSSMNLTLSSSNGGTPVPANQVVTFTLLMENTGNTALSDISVTDATLGTIASGVSLGVGESKTVTAQYTMLQTVTVRATATGKSVIGGVAGMQISSASNEVSVTLAEAGLTIDITPDTLEVSRGDTVAFKGTIANTGTMDISKITVTDVYGVEALKDLTLKPGESKEFTYETTIENSDPYKVYITGVGSDNAEITREFELKFNVKLSEDDVRVDMTVTADYPELEEPDTVIFTFEFYNNRNEPINLPMFVRQVDGPTLFSLVVLGPGTTTQDYEMRIDESSTLRFELVATTQEGEELIAGAAACSITVADQPIKETSNKQENKTNLTWLWILLGIVGFLFAAAAVVFVVLVTQERKNKARRASENGDAGDGYDSYAYGDPYAPDDGSGGDGSYYGSGYDLYGAQDAFGTQDEFNLQGGYDAQNGYDAQSDYDVQNGYSYNTPDLSASYSGSYRSNGYSTGSQFADSLFNDSQIGAVTRMTPQLTDGSQRQDDAFSSQSFSSSDFGLSNSAVFGYDTSGQGYGGTPRQEFQSSSARTDYRTQTFDDDAFLDDLLGDDDWNK